MDFNIIPTDLDGVKLFYAIVIFGCLALNILWDIFSRKTEDFTAASLKGKIGVSYGASTLASSLLVLISVFHDGLALVLGEFWIPLLLAGIAGVLVSLPEVFVVSKTGSTQESPSNRDSDQ